MNFDQTSKKLILLQKTFLPAHAIIVPIAYTQNHTLKAQADLLVGAKDLGLALRLNLLPNFKNVSSEGSDETALITEKFHALANLVA